MNALLAFVLCFSFVGAQAANSGAYHSKVSKTVTPKEPLSTDEPSEPIHHSLAPNYEKASTIAAAAASATGAAAGFYLFAQNASEKLVRADLPQAYYNNLTYYYENLKEAKAENEYWQKDVLNWGEKQRRLQALETFRLKILNQNQSQPATTSDELASIERQIETLKNTDSYNHATIKEMRKASLKRLARAEKNLVQAEQIARDFIVENDSIRSRLFGFPDSPNGLKRIRITFLSGGIIVLSLFEVERELSELSNPN